MTFKGSQFMTDRVFEKAVLMATMVDMGIGVGATPNGRHAYASISQGGNPDPSHTRGGGPTAMAMAAASVQPGYGNTAPL